MDSSVVDACEASNFEAAAGGSAPDQKYGLAAEVPLEGNKPTGTHSWLPMVGWKTICVEVAQISGTYIEASALEKRA